MSLFDEAKTWLRVSTDDEAINSEIEMLVNAAISDLINTADISSDSFEGESVDSLLKLAVRTYVQAYWTDREDRQAKLINSYNEIKAKLVVASAFNGLEG